MNDTKFLAFTRISKPQSKPSQAKPKHKHKRTVSKQADKILDKHCHR